MQRWEAQARGFVPDLYGTGDGPPVDPRLTAVRLPSMRSRPASAGEDDTVVANAVDDIHDDHSSLSESESGADDDDKDGGGVGSSSVGGLFGMAAAGKAKPPRVHKGPRTAAYEMMPVVSELSVNLQPGYAEDVAFERQRQVRPVGRVPVPYVRDNHTVHCCCVCRRLTRRTLVVTRSKPLTLPAWTSNKRCGRWWTR